MGVPGLRVRKGTTRANHGGNEMQVHTAAASPSTFLLFCRDVVAHVFTPADRQSYDLEGLYVKAQEARGENNRGAGPGCPTSLPPPGIS